ncbi:AMP-dependent synthetase/ligase [Saccharopolyspora sp. 5N102]|uniref:AMP-dependent synthetase/ligase n=1 Tax=Saccharopolyspora sp. 5N102 TaxID=3375155 RepID=UPI0037A3E047
MTGTDAAVAPTMEQVPYDCARRFGDLPAQRIQRNGRWEDLSHTELATVVEELARGLIALGVEPGGRICILSETRAEWTQAQFATLAAGAVVVPIYPTNSVQECEWVLGDSGACVVICENDEQVAKITQLRDSLPGLRHILTIEPDGIHDTLDDLRSWGRDQGPAERQRRGETLSSEDPCLIIYTSGTTGNPKGCVLTHGNMMACVEQTATLGVSHPDDVCYLFLPLAHVFAQVVNLSILALGGVVSYVSAGPASILSDLSEIRPTVFPAVPRIFEKIHTLLAGTPANDELHAQVRALFGDRVRFAISGAAPIAPEILEFFHAAGVPVYEGYGLSESTAMGTLNLPEAMRIGTIGRAIPCCETRCDPGGELLLRGSHVFAGYWNDPEATAAAFTEDGWFRTGDLATIDDEGYVSITGRKKEIIITAGGKNLSPAQIENDLRQCPFISHAVLHGDRRPYPVALITLDEEYVQSWATAQGLQTDRAALARLAPVREAVQAAVDEVNARHAKVAQIKRFTILDRDFSQEAGELTPTLKMRRQAINAMYSDVLDQLYEQPAELPR